MILSSFLFCQQAPDECEPMNESLALCAGKAGAIFLFLVCGARYQPSNHFFYLLSSRSNEASDEPFSPSTFKN